MSSGIAIASFMPTITSGTIFSTRRMNSGADAIAQNNPLVGVMNMDIAAGQVANAAKGAANIARETKNSIAAEITSAEESIKALSKGDKIMKGFGKIINFTAENINPIICATGALKVATSKDKKQTAIEEGLALGTMFAFEAGAKRLIGMPKNEDFDKKSMQIKSDGIYKVDGSQNELIAKTGEYKIIDNKLVIQREGLYKTNPFLQKQAEAINDYCNTKKILNNKISLKCIPGIAKGLGFVTASICGYKLGAATAKAILGNEQN